MAQMNMTPLSEIVNEVWGEPGTPDRDQMEARLKEDLQAHYVGEAIKKARLQQNLTQEQLGDRVGVKKAQISKLERGHCISLHSISRVFRALGVTTASLDLGTGIGKVALW